MANIAKNLEEGDVVSVKYVFAELPIGGKLEVDKSCLLQVNNMIVVENNGKLNQAIESIDIIEKSNKKFPTIQDTVDALEEGDTIYFSYGFAKHIGTYVISPKTGNGCVKDHGMWIIKEITGKANISIKEIKILNKAVAWAPGENCLFA